LHKKGVGVYKESALTFLSTLFPKEFSPRLGENNSRGESFNFPVKLLEHTV
jgi:hypothetical protein